jgi:hypothetical protein
MYIGDRTVTSSNGQAFSPGDGAEVSSPPSRSGGVEEFDISQVYIAGTTGESVRVVCWVRE